MHHHEPATTNARHPLCPYCQYDLIATVDPFTPRYVRCPECGEGIEPEDFYFEPRPGEWTLSTGLRNCAVSLATRIFMGIIIWSVVLLAMDQLLTAILGPTGMLSLWTMLLPLTGGGMLIGWVMYFRLTEHAGFESWLVVWFAFVSACVALHFGHVLGNAMFTLNYLNQGGWSVMTGVVAMIWIVYLALHEN
jgi:hypothetical protein